MPPSGAATASTGYASAPALPAGDRVLVGRRDTTQAQLCVGVPALRRDHPDAWILAVLNAVLGDGMSSRLFLSLVDRDALAYDVSSGLVEYADAGALEVSAGVDPGRVGRPSTRSSPSWPAFATSRSRPTSWPRRRPTSPAGWSSGWTRRATWPRGSVARKPFTTGS